MVGINQGGIIENSWSSGTIDGGRAARNDLIGGLVGSHSTNSTVKGIVRNSWSMAAVTVASDISIPASNLGGLIGISIGIIADSYAAGTVTGSSSNEYVGGLVGFLGRTATVTNSYATGDVIDNGSSDRIGGLAGFRGVNATVTGSFHTRVGGNDLGTRLTEADLQTPTNAARGTNLSTWSTFGWDFGTDSQFPALRGYKESGGVQVAGTLLIGQPCPRAQCSPTNPIDDDSKVIVDIDADNDGLIEIGTEEELNNVRHVLDGSGYKSSATADAISTGCPSGGCTGYELTADIALAAPVSPATSNWQPIGSESTPFGAIFEGNGNRITGITIMDSTALTAAFFDTVGSAAVVRNLHVAATISSIRVNTIDRGTDIAGLAAGNNGLISGCSADVTITGSDNAYTESIGGLVGLNQGGIIENSWSSGTIDGGRSRISDAIGGLVGVNSRAGTIRGIVRNSWSMTSVIGDGRSTFFGGLVGASLGIIADSYAGGTVTGSDSGKGLGGLVGTLDRGGTVTNSYATGDVIDDVSSDYIGGVVGVVVPFRGVSVTGSFHTLTGGGNAGTRLTEDQLKMARDSMVDVGGGTMVALFEGWSANSWDFGTNSQFPALRGYKESGGVQVAGTLLIGQPCPRAQCSPTSPGGRRYRCRQRRAHRDWHRGGTEQCAPCPRWQRL